MAAFIGRWFPGPGNHFCKLLYCNYFELSCGNIKMDLRLQKGYWFADTVVQIFTLQNKTCPGPFSVKFVNSLPVCNSSGYTGSIKCPYLLAFGAESPGHFLISGKCLFLSGFTDEQLNHMHDTVLPVKYKMGFTNMVARATPGSKDLTRYMTVKDFSHHIRK